MCGSAQGFLWGTIYGVTLPPSSCFPNLVFWCVKAHLDYRAFPHPGAGVLIIKSLALCEARKSRWQVGRSGQERASMTDRLHMVEVNREE